MPIYARASPKKSIPQACRRGSRIIHTLIYHILSYGRLSPLLCFPLHHQGNVTCLLEIFGREREFEATVFYVIYLGLSVGIMSRETFVSYTSPLLSPSKSFV